ncbi:winged helix DNA-binding domain-containing protein [Actinoplanes sp. L3-i22]|uniref:winged helix DNA-binding domain-containing protein n=1 Tax=Actinoplanes sp. L3-i22 TaxID=2836373 RepID=UPI001C854E92|nr:winged helix DNA-binding domain-containing protein [Actinoplanes sp. L3-i22]
MTSLLLGDISEKSVIGVTTWFGAMQAQDLNSVLWSLGTRLPGRTLPEIVAATEERDVVRTWPMRGTVHLIPSADAHWMLDLTGVRALAGAEKRRAMLGLSGADADKAAEILGAALAGGGRKTRSDCVATLNEGGVQVSGQLGYHLLWYASQRGVTAIAPNEGSEQTFVLLDEWASERNTPSREEALGILAHRYFRSHGPTTAKDFAGWTMLTMKDAKAGIAAAGLTAVDVDGTGMWADPAVLAAGPVRGWHALPGFDEYMLGYKDRSMMATPAQLKSIIPGGNGVFQSTLVQDGRVRAVWKRTLGRKAVSIAVSPQTDFTARDWSAAEEALQPFGAFVGLPVTVKKLE